MFFQCITVHGIEVIQILYQFVRIYASHALRTRDQQIFQHQKKNQITPKPNIICQEMQIFYQYFSNIGRSNNRVNAPNITNLCKFMCIFSAVAFVPNKTVSILSLLASIFELLFMARTLVSPLFFLAIYFIDSTFCQLIL